MARHALIGHTGFVGSNLLRQHAFDDCFNSRNSDQLGQQAYDLVVCAAPGAVKWKANQEPAADRRMIEQLTTQLAKVETECLVQISTVDVYPDPQNVDENTPIDRTHLHPYGLHRLELEDFVRARFPRHLIVRLPALFGPGLKKNFLYDLQHDHLLEWTHATSRFQFYPLNWLWHDIETALQNHLSLLNITSQPVSARQVAQDCFNREFSNQPDKPPAAYDVRSQHAALWSGEAGYLYDWASVAGALRDYLGESA